jgi:hypothetical protein
MPHISTYGGYYFSAQPEKEDFGSFEPREAKLQEASTNDQLIGGKGLNWGEICDVGLSLRKSDDFIKLGDIKGDRLFTTGGGGDFITGEGRSTNIWTNGGASTFEDRMPLDFALNDVVTCNGIDPDIQRPTHPNDNIGGQAGPGGTSYLTGENGKVIIHPNFQPEVDGLIQRGDTYQDKAQLMKHAPKDSEYRPESQVNPVGVGYTEVEWTYFDNNVGTTAGPGGSTFFTDNIGANSGPGGTTFMTGQFDMPSDSISPGDGSRCLV